MRYSLLARSTTIVAACSVVMVLSCGTCARVITADAEATGTLVARLSALDITATLTGELQWTGEAVLGAHPVGFSATGTFDGLGVRGILTTISEAWAGFAATGSTAGGEPVELRGLLYVKRKSVVPLQAGELFVGPHYTEFLVAGEAHSFCGEFSGTAAGALEPAEHPMTIQLGGTGSLHLLGEAMPPSGEFPVAIPLHHPALTHQFLQYVAALNLLMGENPSPARSSHP
jgi:hypothetical protein